MKYCPSHTVPDQDAQIHPDEEIILALLDDAWSEERDKKIAEALERIMQGYAKAHHDATSYYDQLRATQTPSDHSHE